MTTLRTAAQQALEALSLALSDVEWRINSPTQRVIHGAYNNLRATMAQEQAEPTVKESLQVAPVSAVAENATTQQPVVEKPPSDYRRGYWDGFAIGKREGRIEAEDAALKAQEQAEPVQEPVAVRWRHPQYRWTYEDYKPGQFYGPRVEVQRLYTAPPQRKPLTEETMRECAQAMDAEPLAEGWHELIKFARAIEQAHGIGGQE